MYLDQETVDRMVWEDYLAHEERLRVWVETAENMVGEEASRRMVLDFLFWAKVEFLRRRRYLGLEEPELERRAARLIRPE